MCLKGRRLCRSEKSAEVVLVIAGAAEATRQGQRVERERVTKGKERHKAMRASDAGLNLGEWVQRGVKPGVIPSADEVCGPLLQDLGTGLAKPMGGAGGLLEVPDETDGVAKVPPMINASYADRS